jgi:hypothetical protein
VQVDEPVDEPARTAAAVVRRPEVRASVAERAAHWRAMTPAKLERAEQMAAEGASRAEIARKRDDVAGIDEQRHVLIPEWMHRRSVFFSP